MWRKAMVYNLEWLKGNTPSSLCAGTGDNNERLLLILGNAINFKGFVCSGGQKNVPWSILPAAPKLLFAHIPLERKEGIGGEDGVGGPEITGCVWSSLGSGAWSLPTNSERWASRVFCEYASENFPSGNTALALRVNLTEGGFSIGILSLPNNCVTMDLPLLP